MARWNYLVRPSYSGTGKELSLRIEESYRYPRSERTCLGVAFWQARRVAYQVVWACDLRFFHVHVHVHVQPPNLPSFVPG